MRLNVHDLLVEPCVSGGCVISFKTEDMEWQPEFLHKHEGKTFTVEIKEKRKGRSLDANAYYQVLIRSCAEEHGISTAEYHNRSLAEVGIPWLDEEGKAVYVMMKDNDSWLHMLQGEMHYAPTEATEDRKGVAYRWFYLLLPSRMMDSKQMATLIDYVIQDARSLGVQTLEDEKVNKLIAEWRP